MTTDITDEPIADTDDHVVPGFTRAKSAEAAENALNNWIISVAKRMAKQDYDETISRFPTSK